MAMLNSNIYSQLQIIWEMKHDDKQENGKKMSKFNVPTSFGQMAWS
jgi:hypothetical protein